MKKIFNKIMLFIFIFFVIINISISVRADVNSKLQVEIVTDQEEYKLQDEVKYYIKLSNNYGSDLKDINIKVNIPKEMNVVSTKGKVSEGNINWHLDSISSEKPIKLPFVLKSNEKPKPNNIKTPIIIGAITILLAVGAGFLILRNKNIKKKTSIFIVCILSGSILFVNAGKVNAEAVNVSISKAKTIEISNKAYTVNVETTANYEKNENELIVAAERYLNSVILKWNAEEGITYKIEKGTTADLLEGISEEVMNGFFMDKLKSNEQNAYYRVLAYRGEAEAARSAVVEVSGAKDSDDDGLSDEEELRYSTNINNSDTDGDGLSDYLEVYSYKSNPLVKDTDKDKLNDNDEIICKTNPLVKDTDKNGITDDLEDLDGDGLTNYEEILFTSNPANQDSDYDGILDKEEKELGTDPNNLDSDNDRLTDGKEVELRTNPLKEDSNGNGILDGDEIYDIVKSPDDTNIDQNVKPIVNVPLKGAQTDTFEINKIPEDDIFLNSDIPGYIGSGYEFKVDGKFDSATLTYEFNSELLNNTEFEPRIYYFNEKEQKLEELDNQVVEGNKVTTTIEHFSEYILLNKVEFDKVWENEIKPPSSIGEADARTLDIALVIDSSSSMKRSDSNNLRIETSKLFIDKLQENDRGAIVDFDSNAYLLSGFINDKGTLKNAISRIDSSGNTAIYTGINKAFDEFASNGRDSIKNMIVLTDGQDNNPYDYGDIVQYAVNNNIIIYTIGLGSEVDANLLTNIANATGGKYYYASSAGDLLQEFENIKGETIDFVTDSDCDGISDYYEKAINDGKLRLGNGRSLDGNLDINLSDSDGDGLIDGEEIIINETLDNVYLEFNSDPTKLDTDGDGYTDYEERNNATNALVWNISDRDLVMCADIAYHDLVPNEKFDTTSFREKINQRFGPKAHLEELKGWEVWAIFDCSYTGLQAAVYKKDNNLIVAFRGSESDDFADKVLDWGYADIGGVLMGFSAQSEQAERVMGEIMQQSSQYNIYITGHSLGGNLAYYAAATAIEMDPERVKEVAVFNGLGVFQTKGKISPSDKVNKILKNAHNNIVDYRVHSDIVSTIPGTIHYGQIKEYNLSRDLLTFYVKDFVINVHILYTFFEKIGPFNRPIP